MLDRLLIAGGSCVLPGLGPLVLVSYLTAFYIRWTSCCVWSVLWTTCSAECTVSTMLLVAELYVLVGAVALKVGRGI